MNNIKNNFENESTASTCSERARNVLDNDEKWGWIRMKAWTEASRVRLLLNDSKGRLGVLWLKRTTPNHPPNWPQRTRTLSHTDFPISQSQLTAGRQPCLLFHRSVSCGRYPNPWKCFELSNRGSAHLSRERRKKIKRQSCRKYIRQKESVYLGKMSVTAFGVVMNTPQTEGLSRCVNTGRMQRWQIKSCWTKVSPPT